MEGAGAAAAEAARQQALYNEKVYHNRQQLAILG